MKHEQREFIERLTASWRHEFPFLKQVHIKETPQIPKGCNFLVDARGLTKQRHYFIQLIFSQKKRAEFTIEIVISSSSDHSSFGPATESLSPMSIGSFGIWKFMGRQRFAWALVDLDAENRALLGISSGLLPSPNVWRPTTYNQPFKQIADEAISHLNHTLRQSVFSILQIDGNQ